MRKIVLRPVAIVLAVALLVGTTTAFRCGEIGEATVQNSIRIIKSALQAAPVLVNSLVASGVLSRTVADGDIRDLTRTATIAITLEQDIVAIPAGVADRAVRLSRAAKKAADGWRVVLADRQARGVKTHPRIEQAFAVADGIFLFVEAFYADQAGEAPHNGDLGLSEKEFYKQLEQRARQLESITKGK